MSTAKFLIVGFTGVYSLILPSQDNIVVSHSLKHAAGWTSFILASVSAVVELPDGVRVGVKDLERGLKAAPGDISLHFPEVSTEYLPGVLSM